MPEWTKQILTFFLSIALLLSPVPNTAYADEAKKETQEREYKAWKESVLHEMAESDNSNQYWWNVGGITALGTGGALFAAWRGRAARESYYSRLETLKAEYPDLKDALDPGRKRWNTQNEGLKDHLSKAQSKVGKIEVGRNLGPEMCAKILGKLPSAQGLAAGDFVTDTPTQGLNWKNPFDWKKLGQRRSTQKARENQASTPADESLQKEVKPIDDERIHAVEKILEEDGEIHEAYKLMYETFSDDAFRKHQARLLGIPVEQLRAAPTPKEILIDVPWTKKKIVNHDAIEEYLRTFDTQFRAKEVQLIALNKGFKDKLGEAFGRGQGLAFKKRLKALWELSSYPTPALGIFLLSAAAGTGLSYMDYLNDEEQTAKHKQKIKDLFKHFDNMVEDWHKLGNREEFLRGMLSLSKDSWKAHGDALAEYNLAVEDFPLPGVGEGSQAGIEGITQKAFGNGKNDKLLYWTLMLQKAEAKKGRDLSDADRTKLAKTLAGLSE